MDDNHTMFDDIPNHNPPDQTILWHTLGWEDETYHQEMMQARLRQRAERYAKPLIEDDNVPTITVVIFRLGDEIYGIDALLVHAVRRIGSIALVPNIPEFYLGVVNVRGQIVTVLDLRRFFGKQPIHDVHLPDELLVVRANDLELGLLAHSVEDVVTLKLNDIQLLNDMGYAWGITPQRVILLDVTRLFADERLIIGKTETTV